MEIIVMFHIYNDYVGTFNVICLNPQEVTMDRSIIFC